MFGSVFVILISAFFTSRGVVADYYGDTLYELSLETKLNILTNEVSRLSEELSDRPDPSDLVPVSLISAHRSSGQNGNIYTLRYKKNVDPVYVDSTDLDSVHDEPDGTTSATFACKPDSDCSNRYRTVSVSFKNSNGSSELKLILNTTGSNSLYQDEFIVPLVMFKSDGDLLYHEGNDAKIEVSGTARSGGYNDKRRVGYMSASVRIVNLQNGHFEKWSTRDYLTRRDSTRYLKTQDSLITIFTSRHNMSGFLDVKKTSYQTRNGLIKEIEVKQSKVFRPFGQAGPYPDNFIKMHNTGYYHYESGGHERFESCEIGKECTIKCEAVGTVTSLTVTQKQEDGTWTPVSNVEESDHQYSKAVEWTIQARDDLDDPTFRCNASNSNASEDHLVNVKFFTHNITFDPSRSGVAIIDGENENQTLQMMTLQCAAIGRPIDSIYMSWQSNTGLRHIAYYADLERGRHEVIARATVLVNTTLEGEFVSADCTAHNIGYRDYHTQLELHSDDASTTSEGPVA